MTDLGPWERDGRRHVLRYGGLRAVTWNDRARWLEAGNDASRWRGWSFCWEVRRFGVEYGRSYVAGGSAPTLRQAKRCAAAVLADLAGVRRG